MRGESELAGGWAAVQYELSMLTASARRLSEGPPTQDDVNAYLESFLVHYRNLIDFLAPRRSASDDDIKASDFAPGFASTAAPVQYRTPIDKRLAHLSYKRLDVAADEKGWDLRRLLAEMRGAWAEFEGASGAAPMG